MKKIDLKKTIYEIVNEYPEVKDIMKDLGFNQIVDPKMLNTVGRVMTIDKGARMKNIPIDKIVKAFRDNGFTLIGKEI